MIMRRKLKMHASENSCLRYGEEVFLPVNINPDLPEHFFMKCFYELSSRIDESPNLNDEYTG